MKTLVTGGAGFIGSHLVEALLAADHEVIVVDNLVTGYKANLKEVEDKITFVEGSAGDEKLMMSQLKGVDIVYHQAALTSVPRSMKNPLESFHETLTASVMALDCARKNNIKRFIFATSSSAYGNRSEDVKSEELYPAPMSPYAAAKVSLEMFANAYSLGFDMETVGLRYFNVFGPRQDPQSDYAAVIPLFIRKIMAGEKPIITGDGDQSRDFTFVANVVSANLLAMEATLPTKNNVINVATGQRQTLPELVQILNRVAGTELEPQYVEARPGDVKHSLADISLAKKILNYKVEVPFEEGLQKTWTYAKKYW
jgi:UDP-glucose 4-epimerase